MRKLENFDRKERVDVDSYTIEHVMPQNPDLSPEWQEELGPEWKTVQERWLHTIGNLTLTGYNSELSDRPVQREADDEGRLPRQPAAPEPVPRAARPLERAGDPEARRNCSPTSRSRSGRRRSCPEETLAKYRKTKAKVGDRLHARRPPGARRATIRPLFDELRRRVLNLDAGVHEEVRKQYIAYKLTTNFVEVVPLANELKLYLDITIDELNDPHDSARDVSSRRPLGDGERRGAPRRRSTQLEDVMALVRQSFERQGEEGYEEPQWSQAGVERVVEQAGDPAVQQALLAGRRGRRAQRPLPAAVEAEPDVRAAGEPLAGAVHAQRPRRRSRRSLVRRRGIPDVLRPRTGRGRAPARRRRARPRCRPRRSRRSPSGSTS